MRSTRLAGPRLETLQRGWVQPSRLAAVIDDHGRYDRRSLQDVLTRILRVTVGLIAYGTMGALGVRWLRRFGEDPANRGVDFKL